MSEFKRSKKFSFDDEPKKEEKVEEPAAEFPSVFSSPVENVTKTPIEGNPVMGTIETPIKEGDKEPEAIDAIREVELTKEQAEEIKKGIEKSEEEIVKVEIPPQKPAKSPEKKADDEWVQPEGPVIPKVFNLREEIEKLLVINKDEEMCKTLVTFGGTNSHYYIAPVQPRLVYDAWKLYAEHEAAIPGKFMEMVFDILKVKDRGYFHKVSIVELR